MNKFFIISMIIISLLNLLYFNLKDILLFQKTKPPEFSFLKDFNKNHKNIQEIGFYSDEENPIHVKYRIQNSIMPIFLKDSIDANYIFCYSLNEICQYFISSKQADLVTRYNNNLFLLKKPEGTK